MNYFKLKNVYKLEKVVYLNTFFLQFICFQYHIEILLLYIGNFINNLINALMI